MSRGRFKTVADCVIVANTGLLVAGLVFPDYEALLGHVELACLAFFGVELLWSIRAEGRAFFRKKWNWADTAIILLSALPVLAHDMGILRIARLARVFHVGKHVTHLRMLRLAMFAAAKAHWRLRVGHLPLVIREGG